MGEMGDGDMGVEMEMERGIRGEEMAASAGAGEGGNG
jgi:hypothetical protein